MKYRTTEDIVKLMKEDTKFYEHIVSKIKAKASYMEKQFKDIKKLEREYDRLNKYIKVTIMG